MSLKLNLIYIRFRQKMQEQAEEEERLRQQEAIDGQLLTKPQTKVVSIDFFRFDFFLFLWSFLAQLKFVAFITPINKSK